MFRSILFLLMVLSCWDYAQAQSVMNAAGNTIMLPGMIVEYSVGEVATTTLNLTDGPVTQGLLQPTLTSPYIVVPANEAFDKQFGFKCYPNPTINFLVVETNYLEFSQIEFVDGTGRIALNINFDYTPIECSNLAAGTYFVRLFSNNKPETR